MEKLMKKLELRKLNKLLKTGNYIVVDDGVKVLGLMHKTKNTMINPKYNYSVN